MADDDVTIRVSLQGGQDMARQVRGIDDDVRRLILDVRVLGRTDSDLNRLTTSTRSMRQEFGQLHGQVLGVATAVTNPLLNGLRLAGYGFAGATVAAGAFGVKALSSFDQTQTALDTLTGSISRGHALMGELQQYDLSTAFNFSDISAAAQTLEQFNITGAQTIPVLKVLGDVAALSTNPSENLSRMALAIGQISAAGTVKAQDLNQLIQAGFPAYQVAGSAAGISPAQLRRNMDAGEGLDSTTFLNAVLGYAGPLASRRGAAVRVGSQSLGGALSNLQSSVTQQGVRSALPYRDQLASEVRGVTTDLTGLVQGVGPEFFHMLSTIGDLLVKELPHAQPILMALFGGIDKLVTQSGPGIDRVLGQLSGEAGQELDQVFAQLVPVMPDLVDAFVHLVMVLPEFLLLLAQMIRMSEPIIEFVDDLLSLDGGRKVIAGLLVTLLAYRGVSAVIGPIVGVTNALRALAGAEAVAGAGGVGGGARGAAGLFGRIGAGGAAEGAAGLGVGGTGAAGAGIGLAAVGGLELWKTYSDHHSNDVDAAAGYRQPDWWDRLRGRMHGAQYDSVTGQGVVNYGGVTIHANDARGGQAAAQAFIDTMNQRQAMEDYANQRALRR